MAANLAEEIKQADGKTRRESSRKQKSRRLALWPKLVPKRKSVSRKAKQELHQLFRQEVSKAEAEAEKRADAIKAEGKRETETFVQARKDRVGEVSSWLVEEVTAKYGLS